MCAASLRVMGTWAHSSVAPASCKAMSSCARSAQKAASRVPTYRPSASRYFTTHSSTTPRYTFGDVIQGLGLTIW